MHKRTLAFLVLVMATLLVVPTTVSAQTDDTSADATVAGRGWLKARGTGTAEVEMAGFMRLRIDGDVTIVDHAGDLRATVRADGADPRRQQVGESGDIVLTDFEGVVKLKGSHFEVVADGAMVIKAKGKGVATLTGDGVFRTRRGPWRTWDGAALQIGEGLQPA
ncbi:MAG: hypothetical protein ACR2QE_02390 [Acidimicrobiales bacterium]